MVSPLHIFHTKVCVILMMGSYENKTKKLVVTKYFRVSFFSPYAQIFFHHLVLKQGWSGRPT